jgi:phosphopentomutase
MKYKRVFLIVLDSVGIGEQPDSYKYGDEGSNTIRSISKSKNFDINMMRKMGIFNIDDIGFETPVENPISAYCKLQEVSMGKDTTTGHWEMSGVISSKPFPTYPNGFPKEVIDEFSKQIGRGVLCNKPYSGTEVIKAYGEEHLKTGDIIVYTSADSVFQIAAHEKVVPLETLYEYCRIARKILQGENAVGRVIARPFDGTNKDDFFRTKNRHDFSLVPPRTMLNDLKDAGKDVIAVGKINDIFAGSGVTEKYFTRDNFEGTNQTYELLSKDFTGLCFVNLVDFDMLYGHRNNVDGYAKAYTEFDKWLEKFIPQMQDTDVLMITADHGCDPATPSTDHSREYIPLLVYGKNIKPVNLGIRQTFADIGKTIDDFFGITSDIKGTSFLKDIEI